MSITVLNTATVIQHIDNIFPEAAETALRVLNNFSAGNREGWGCPNVECPRPPAYVAVRQPFGPNWWLNTPCIEHAPAPNSLIEYVLVAIPA